MAVTVPEAPSRSPLRWDVVAWRLIGSLAVVFAAMVVSVLPVGAHWWNSRGARLVCEEIPGWQVRAVQGGWAEPNECLYTDATGRTMAHLSATLGPPNWFEPRTSFVVSTVVLVVIWGLAFVALWFIWHAGRARRLPRDAGRILVA